jgi:hypothetical protein
LLIGWTYFLMHKRKELDPVNLIILVFFPIFSLDWHLAFDLIMKYNFFKIYINYSLERKKEKKRSEPSRNSSCQRLLYAFYFEERNERKWFSVQVKIEIWNHFFRGVHHSFNFFFFPLSQTFLLWVDATVLLSKENLRLRCIRNQSKCIYYFDIYIFFI